MPEQFANIPAMAVLCKIDRFPSQFMSKSDFIEKNLMKGKGYGGEQAARVKVQVDDMVKADNPFLHVTMLESTYENNFVRYQNENKYNKDLADGLQLGKLTVSNVEKLFSRRTLKKFKYSDAPVFANDIPAKIDQIQPETRILIYPMVIVQPNLIYGQCREIAQCVEDNKELTRLMTRMNDGERKYELLKTMPILNEMVIVAEMVMPHNGRKRFYRGMVHEIFEDVCMVSQVQSVCVAFVCFQFKNYPFADFTRGLWALQARKI
jgi:hypothetical protein